MNSRVFSLFISFSLLLNPLSLMAYSATPADIQKKNQQIELGNKYAKQGHDDYSTRNYLKAAQSYEKAYEATKHKVYLDNAVVAYTNYAFDLTNDKKYDEAIKYCNKVLSLKPNDKNAKEVLSEVYFSRGADYFYTGNLEKAKSDFETSLKYSVLQDQIDRAKDGIAKVETALKNNTVPIPQYQTNQDIAIPEVVNRMETKVYGVVNNSDSLVDRITKLEKDAMGKNYASDGLIIRVDRLKRVLLPEYVAQSQPIQAQGYENNYIKEIIDQSMGRVSIFGKIPITVYIESSNVKPYKKFYENAAIEGFKEWEKASENRIKFDFINNPAHADIKVVWTENFEDFPWQPELKKDDLSAEKERMKYRKASAAVRVGSILGMVAGGLFGVPIIGGLGAIGNSVASPILQYKGTNMERLSPDLKINTKITEGMTDEAARTTIKQIATHQMGHALGIFGHSPDPNDIMYSNFTATQLSERDINTIREIYKSKEPQKD